MKRVPAKTFQDLVVWQTSHQCVLQVDRYSADFPRSEIYGLTQQIRRAAVSIPPISPKGSRSVVEPTRPVS